MEQVTMGERKQSMFTNRVNYKENLISPEGTPNKNTV